MKRLILFFTVIFMLSLVIFYAVDFYLVENRMCSPYIKHIDGAVLSFYALTSTGRYYFTEENKTYGVTLYNNTDIYVVSFSNGTYVLTLKAGNMTLMKSKYIKETSKTSLMVFSGRHKGEYESIGSNLFFWYKPCSMLYILLKLGLIHHPYYMGEPLSLSVLKRMVHIDRFYNITNGITEEVTEKKHIIQDVLVANGPELNITDPLSGDWYNVHYFYGVYKGGVPINLEFVVPVNYVNLTSIEYLVGFKPEHVESIRYFQVGWGIDWSETEKLKNQPFIFSDLDVLAISLLAGIIGDIVYLKVRKS